MAINEKQKLFCHYYAFGLEGQFNAGHGGKSYAEAYNLNFNINKSICYSSAARLLRNVQISSYISKLFESNGLYTDLIDTRLRNIIINGSDSDALQAIREYHRITGRYKQLKQIKSGLFTKSIQQQAIDS